MKRCRRIVFVVIPTILAVTSAASGNSTNANGDICALPPDVGPCDGICPRYIFNSETDQCEEFIFGCCEGNANNFPTMEACEAACVSGAAGAIPTVSAWGLFALVLLVMAAGTIVFRRARSAN